MGYQIEYKEGRRFQKMSPFPARTLPFTEATSSTNSVTITPGTTLPSLIRELFKVDVVDGFKGKFGFLDRDNKQRVYQPGTDDPFVFRNDASVKDFGNHALALIKVIADEWEALGLPLKHVKEKQIYLPDSSALFDALLPGHPLHQRLVDMYPYICFLTSNADIMRKACVVRNIYIGWWGQSYAGKDAPDPKHFDPAMRVLLKAIAAIENSSRFGSTLDGVMRGMGDPMDTNAGFPFFAGHVDEMGNPVTKEATLQLFEGIGTAGYDFSRVVDEIAKRCKPMGLEKYPFLIAPLRRVQPSDKPNHEYRQTSFGLVTSHDSVGMNQVRIAWMAPYVYNLYLSPLQARWKAVRKLLPGMFFDGSAKRNRLARLSRTNPWLAEADYSNYDRFMPINLFQAFTQGYLSRYKNAEYWRQLTGYLHQGMSIIWPDYLPGSTGKGWIFKPRYGLLSGVKVTSEEGTFINGLVNCQSLLDSGIMNEASLYKYLTQYVGPGDKSVGSGNEFFFIQSDDDLLVCDSPTQLYKLGTSFKLNTARAGLKGSLEIGDRFLMRHTLAGRDTPVPSRVWQNTLSNEDSYLEPITFLAGLCMRTDGLLGHKSYDPFGTGKRNRCTSVEVRFTLAMLNSLLKFLQTASKKQLDAIDYIKVLIEAASNMLANYDCKKPGILRNDLVMSSDDASRVDGFRMKSLELLAKSEADKLARLDSQTFNLSWLYRLHKDRHVPSSALLLDSLIARFPYLKNLLESVANREYSYYQYAMKKMKIPLSMESL